MLHRVHFPETNGEENLKIKEFLQLSLAIPFLLAVFNIYVAERQMQHYEDIKTAIKRGVWFIIRGILI
jgi:ribosomal protein L11 methylase PrmA